MAVWVLCGSDGARRLDNDVPYDVAIVELIEGIRLHSNIVECDNGDLTIGMPGEVVFEKIDDEITLPKFRPRRG